MVALMLNEESSSEAAVATSKRRGVRIPYWFLVLGLAAVVLSAVTWRTMRRQPAADSVDVEARTLLRSYKSGALEGDLEKLLADPKSFHVASIRHPLIGTRAPDFRLLDWQGRSVRLGQLLETGPVVLIFYYGYWCDHCVVQLFDVSEEMKWFRALGAHVVAVSADTPEETASKFQKFGRFDFDVLSDPDHRVASAYACFDPVTENTPERMFHGTFVIDRDGTIVWGDIADQPFRSTKTLLYELRSLREKGAVP